ncbi:hypothetical protein TNCV_4389141 [Trichonephila clavipes]|nr:hypothetical protein TNCV_4389141 [Trichonephila clavipes]
MSLCKQKHQITVHAHTWFFATTFAMKLRLDFPQSGKKMERYTKAELADMHLTYRTADCNGQAAWRLYQKYYLRKQNSQLLPSLHACARDCPTADPSSWTLER